MVPERRITAAHVLQMINSPSFYEKVPEFTPVRESVAPTTARIRKEVSEQQRCKACGVARKVQQEIVNLFVSFLVAQKQNTETMRKLKQYLSEDMNMSAERYILICRTQNSNQRIQVVF